MGSARLVVWDENECATVHAATLSLLAETGVEVRYAPALEVLGEAGARVDGRRVRLPAQMVARALETAPRTWLLKPRGGDTRPLELKDGSSYFGTGSDVLYVARPRHAASAAACARPTSRAWRPSARSCPTSTS